ncbi:MAG: ACT domain-containing protein [Acidobacteriota bacterium]
MSKDRGKQMRVRLWEPPYAVARLRAVPAELPGLEVDGPPVTLLVGHGEVSLLAPESVADRLGDLVEESSRGWRAFTLDAVFPLDSVGVLAAVGAALADVGVPIMVLSSHDTDHFLVPGHLLGRTLAALNQIRLGRFLVR